MTGADYLDYDKTLNRGFKLLRGDKTKRFGLLVICGVNLGLRIDDLRKLTFDQLRSDTITIVEGKTKKKRILKVNDHIKLALTYFESDIRGYAFISQKGTPFTSQHINRLLKQHLKGLGGSISTHSLRKTFGRRVWEVDSQSDRALTYLSELFNHSSTYVTRTYLGIQQEELNDIYMSL